MSSKEKSEFLQIVEIDTRVESFPLRHRKASAGKPEMPPPPPPMPPRAPMVFSDDPCYFEDGIRKIDFVLVYTKDMIEDPEGNEKITNFVLKLEEFGLEMEGADSFVDDKVTFVKVHGKDSILLHYAKLYNINLVMESPFYMAQKPPALRCMRNEATSPNPSGDIYKRAHEILSGVRPDQMSDAERIMVIAQIMKMAHYGPQSEARGLENLVKECVFTDAYPIHDGYIAWPDYDQVSLRQILRRYWSSMSQCFKEQPIQLIEKYYGPNVAFYFAWMGHYTKMLAPLALISLISFASGLINMKVYSKEICTDDDNVYLCPLCKHYAFCDFRKLRDLCLKKQLSYVLDNSVSVFLAVCTSIWANVFVLMWKREQRRLALMWDLDRVIITDVPRTDFLVKADVEKISSTTGLPEKRMSGLNKYSRIAVTYVACVTMVLVIILIMAGVAVLRVATYTYLNGQGKVKHAQLIASCVGAAASILFMVLFDVISKPLVYKLNVLEVPRTQWEFDNSLVYKTFLIAFVNTFAPVFYLAFIKGKFFEYPGQRYHENSFSAIRWARCDVGGCGLDLAIQLFGIMVYKNVTRNFLALLNPALEVCKKQLKYGIYHLVILPRWEQDWFLNEIDYYHVHKEYMEMALQYGFVTFFVAAFPLVPLFAFLTNIFELRLDASKLTNRYRRPVPKQVPGMGAWMDIIQILTHVGAVINAFVIAFTGEFISRTIYQYEVDFSLKGYVYSTLSEFDVADYPDVSGNYPPPTVSVCHYTGKRYPPGHENQYELTTQHWYEVAIKFLFVFIFEHVIIVINSLLLMLVNKVPGSVRRRIRFENHHLKEMRVKVLNEAYKKRHGNISTTADKKMQLPKVNVILVD